MSILKAILHRWNKTTKTYDTLHPETETSQITDFDTAVNGKINTHNSSGAAHSTLFNQCEKTSSLANDIVTKLAQTTAISVISALQTNSWFGQLLKLVLNASGMKYLIAQNGYICFGSFFGGLIIQWVTLTVQSGKTTASVALPIAFSSITIKYVGSRTADNAVHYGEAYSASHTEAAVYLTEAPDSGTLSYNVIVIGK